VAGEQDDPARVVIGSRRTLHVASALRARARAPLAAQRFWAYVFISPTLLALLVFATGPILFTFWVSAHDWNMLTPVAEMPYVGPANYLETFGDDVFQAALRNTFVFTIVGVGINFVLGLGGALLLSGRLRGRILWRTIFFLPIVTTPLALGIIWRTLLDKNNGLVNGLLASANLPRQPFLDSPDQALGSIISMAVYQYVGYYIIVFLAGLHAIPAEYYDAAATDGAGPWQAFWYITVPLLRPVMLFLVITNTIGALQVFDVVFAATTSGAETSGGGPANSTMVLVLHMYNTAFKFFRMGNATAMAAILFAITLLITLLQFRLLRQRT
jgi:ABC-type sugar transport system permease subunit